jgi:hypothetical protein
MFKVPDLDECEFIDGRVFFWDKRNKCVVEVILERIHDCRLAQDVIALLLEKGKLGVAKGVSNA